MSDADAHSRLLEGSPGYRAFVAELDYPPEDVDMIEAFAGWLTIPGQEGDWFDWTEEQFEMEWDRWNS